MSVYDVLPVKSHAYTGVGDYEFEFYTLLSTDVSCYVVLPDGTTSDLVRNEDFSVVLAVSPVVGGTVTIDVDNNPTATILVISRNMPYTQTVSWENGGPLNQNTITWAFDKLTMLIQQMRADVAPITSWRGDWATAIVYSIGDVIWLDSSECFYACAIAHTSGTFATDLASGYWFLALNISELYEAAIADAVSLACGDKAPVASPTFTGVPAGPTAASGADTTQLATTEFVQQELDALPVVPLAVQVFTSSGTYTKTTGATIAIVEVVGGGGGGAGFNTYSGKSGGAGGYSRKRISLAAVTTETVTIGASGAGGGANTAGGNGGTTSFGAHCSATGGTGGGPYVNGTHLVGAAGGDGSGGGINLSGGAGGSMYDAGGGVSYFGGGPTQAGVGGAYGAGGAGSGLEASGGAGKAGVVIVTEY